MYMRDVFCLECWHSRFPAVYVCAIPRYDYEPEGRDTHSGRNSNTTARHTRRDISVTPRQCVSAPRVLCSNCHEFRKGSRRSRSVQYRRAILCTLLTVQVVKGAGGRPICLEVVPGTNFRRLRGPLFPTRARPRRSWATLATSASTTRDWNSPRMFEEERRITLFA